MDDQTRYLSQGRYNELVKELDYLKNNKRMEIADALKRAKEYGDLSENSEYAEAREDQRRLEAKIFELEELLKQAKIIHKSKNSGTVQVGSTVKVKKGTETLTYTIVGSNESNPQKKMISNESPLGRAFLGKEKGDTVKVETPAGSTEYKILSIE